MTAPPTAPVARQSGAKGLFLSVVVVLFATLLSVIVLEGGASWLIALLDYRGASATTLRPSVQRDTLLGWSGKANYANPNAFGRGVALTLDASGARMSAADSGLANRSSFVCSGDSYTFGLGVGDPQPWCAVLQHLLMLRGVNLAQPDFGIDQSYLEYRRDGQRAPQQRLHLFAVTVAALEHAGSATFQGRNKPYFTLENGSLTTHNVPVPPQSAGSLRRAAAERSFDNLRVMRVLRDRGMFDRNGHVAETVEARLPAFEKMIGELAIADRARGVRFALVFLPTGRDRRPGRPDTWRKALASIATRQGVPWIDLSPELRALRPDSADIAFITPPSGGSVPFSGQYSAMGHTWVARTLEKKLRADTTLAGVLSAPGRASPARRD